VGLTAGHTHGHLFRALLEGIAYEYATWADLASSLGQQRLAEARVLGGGAGSRLWNQIKADVLGIRWVPTRRQECGVLGDALVAAAATGHVTDLAATAKQWQSTAEPVVPDPEHTRAYARMRTAYTALIDHLPEVMDRLQEAHP
jgi:sugar (pentulose or hexulose) kinase